MAQAMNNQLAVVTGGSSGIGFELARQFVEHGYDVIIAAEDDGVNEAANRLQKGKAKVQAVQVILQHVRAMTGCMKKSKRPADRLTLSP